jgi:parallel beta-helix repeat protein
VGVWCDIQCTHVTYSDNRVHHNSLAGLHLETSSGAKIFGNVVWENGWDDPSRSWNPGIKLAGSSNAEVYANTVAWNASGISVINAPREQARWNAVKDVYVHDNSILSTEDQPALSWIQTDGWAGGTMADPAANNRGANNEYWYGSPEGSVDRFRWTTNRLRTLVEFNATPGEDGGRYLDEARKELINSSASIPSSPEPH